MVDFGSRMHLVTVGGHHQVQGNAQEQPQVQKSDKRIFQIDIIPGIYFIPADVAPDQQKCQYEGNKHEQSTCPDMNIEN